MLSQFLQVLLGNPVISIVFFLILLLLGVCIGYFIGNTSIQKKVSQELFELENKGFVQRSVIDNIGLGVIVYGNNRAIYNNDTVCSLQGFLQDGVIPDNMGEFLNVFDKDNQLKSNYMLGLENGINITRANYVVDKKIYEIKILRKNLEGTELQNVIGDYMELVIVDDITQIKDDQRRQKDLAANVSHELKTPLTVIKASEFFFQNVTPDNLPTYDEINRWGSRIIQNADRMQDIVEDFLVLSMTSNTNKMGIFDIRQDAMKAISNISDYPGRDRVNVILPEEGVTELVFGNARLAMRLIINLLTNAVKYIGFDGKTETDEIKVTIINIDDRIGVQVEDNGRGILQKDLDHLFERFYRVDNSGSRDVGGSGIGLAIAKEVAEMHDGSISVTSQIGHGSTFMFSMPTARSVFKMCYEDAKAGIVSDNAFYRSAAFFLGLQITEAVRSLGYDDLLPVVEELESADPARKLDRDKKLANLIRTFGDERFEELLDELLYIDTDMDGFDEDFDIDELPEDVPYEEPVVAEVATTTTAVTEPVKLELYEPEQYFDDEQVNEEEINRQQKELEKEEARKLLTQTILPRSSQFIATDSAKTVANDDNKKDSVQIHPSEPIKRYNSEERKNGKRDNLFENILNKGEPEVKSSLKKMLDETPKNISDGKKG